MPNGDGTGPDGKGPKKENKGWPRRYGNGQQTGPGKGGRKGKGQGLRKRDGSCKQP
jgi:hypothetical protein